MTFREMDRRIDVRPAVFGRAKAVGLVVVALLGEAGRQLLEHESLDLCRPEDGLAVEGVAHVDDLSARKAEIGWLTRDVHGGQEKEQACEPNRAHGDTLRNS